MALGGGPQVESVLMSRHLDSRGFDLRDAALLRHGVVGVVFFCFPHSFFPIEIQFNLDSLLVLFFFTGLFR